MIAAAVQKVLKIVESSIRSNWLFNNTAAMAGPTARARLAADCIIPRTLPCSFLAANLDARLVKAGEDNEFPNEKNVTLISNAISPPLAGPM